MDSVVRPFRSALYIPGSKLRALEKARELEVDAIIFDLEDAISPSEKPAARRLLVEVLAATDFGQRARIVRINGLDTEWGAEDIAALTGVRIEALLIPKVSTSADVEAVARRIPEVPLWAMMETARGMLNAAEIAAHPRL